MAVEGQQEDTSAVESKTDGNPTLQEMESNLRIGAEAGLQDTDEYKAEFASYEKLMAESGTPVQQQSGAPSGEQRTAEQIAADAAAEEELSNAFGVGTRPTETPTVEGFKSLEEFNSKIEADYSIKDANTFLESFDKHRKNAQKGAEFESKYKATMKEIGALPKAIKKGIEVYTTGGDYAKAFNENVMTLDLTKPFESHDKKAIVKEFYGKTLKRMDAKLASEENDFTQEDYDAELNDLHGLGREQYTSRKSLHDSERDRIQSDTDRWVEQFNSATEVSVQSLQEDYPNFREEQLGAVKAQLAKGSVDKLFFNEDGTPKKDAAKMVSMALFGDDAINSLTKSAKAEGKTEANLNIVANSKKKPEASGQGTGGQNQDHEGAAAAKQLDEFIQNDVYASKL